MHKRKIKAKPGNDVGLYFFYKSENFFCFMRLAECIKQGKYICFIFLPQFWDINNFIEYCFNNLCRFFLQSFQPFTNMDRKKQQ